jgi:hypothetical protein
MRIGASPVARAADSLSELALSLVLLDRRWVAHPKLYTPAKRFSGIRRGSRPFHAGSRQRPEI